MKALRLESPCDLRLVEIPVPSVGDCELLVRCGASTICTSDLNDMKGGAFGISLPVVMGHEGAGTVVSVGNAVEGFKEGDRVAAHPVHPCGRCADCRRGLGHLCPSMKHFGLNMQGTFAEYFTVRQDRARRIPDTLDFVTAALLEPVCVCLEALDRARVETGMSLLIVGDGFFGVLMARLAKRLRGVRTVISGRHGFRLGFAGGAVRVNTKEHADLKAALLAANEGCGYDAAILAVASAQSVDETVSLLRPRGRLVLFSALAGQTPVDLLPVHVKELAIIGACNDADKMNEAAALLSCPELSLGELVTQRFPLAGYREAFRLAEAAREESLKVAFTFEGDEIEREDSHDDA